MVSLSLTDSIVFAEECVAGLEIWNLYLVCPLETMAFSTSETSKSSKMSSSISRHFLDTVLSVTGETESKIVSTDSTILHKSPNLASVSSSSLTSLSLVLYFACLIFLTLSTFINLFAWVYWPCPWIELLSASILCFCTSLFDVLVNIVLVASEHVSDLFNLVWDKSFVEQVGKLWLVLVMSFVPSWSCTGIPISSSAQNISFLQTCSSGSL